MKVKDLEFTIYPYQRCDCVVRSNDINKEDRNVWGPFISIYHVISKYDVVDIYTTNIKGHAALGLILQEES